jgi:hypothetical protein
MRRRGRITSRAAIARRWRIAPGELEGMEIAPVPELEAAQDLLDGLLDAVGQGAQVLKPERDVIPDPLAEELVIGILEHVAHPARPLGGTQAPDLDASHPEAAPRRAQVSA